MPLCAAQFPPAQFPRPPGCPFHAICLCCPEKHPAPRGVPIFDSNSEGGYQNFTGLRGGGRHFLRALFLKRTTPLTRNSEQSLTDIVWNISPFLPKLSIFRCSATASFIGMIILLLLMNILVKDSHPSLQLGNSGSRLKTPPSKYQGPCLP